MKTVAMQLGMDVISLAEYEVPKEVIAQVSEEIARRYKIVPVFSSDNSLTVALSDPLDIETLDSLRYILKRNVEGIVALEEEIEVALDHYYGLAEMNVDRLVAQTGHDELLRDVSVREGDDEDTVVADEDAPIIKLVSLIIVEAQRNRASDIHLEPLENRFRVRYRIDGVLHEVESPPKRLQATILSRIKLMAGMKIAEKRVPQDGRIEISTGGKTLDLRVSTVPTAHGESIVMRILDKTSLMLGLPELGFMQDDQQLFERLINSADGILLVTGPTGSGKTTTLYSCLHFLNRSDRKIITVEDPVEYQLDGINQVQIRADIGLDYPFVLRSMLRQAPNIIMVGEIRDRETAEIAINASLTGHLVFSTLHTNDAPSAIPRMLDIGVKPFLLASALRATMAQRLVRVICENCKREVVPDKAELKLLGSAAAQISDIKLFAGKGCSACSNTGHKGRKGIFEIFLVDDEVQQMIYNKLPADELRANARLKGMRTLREDGLRKVVSGMTSLSEVLAVTMGDAD
ncbi:MAG: Flp pilus assembly complex ATPase component TadA, partial [Lentisphaerae bacterium]|nr:Flp pilus assembly complex ATPase component TadA [Lentisphaerota bacterium]